MKLLFAMALLQAGGEECPASLAAQGYSSEVASLTQPYIDCMTRPWLPTEAQLAEKRASCAPVRAQQVSHVERELERHPLAERDRHKTAGDTFDWVDHVVANLPGCETRISIAGDGIESPDAAN